MFLACRRILTGIGALWLLSVPHLRPQLTGAQFQEIQRQQEQALQNEWTTSHWDLGQNIRLDAIDSHLNATDARAENLRDKHESLAREVSESHGEQTVWFSIISAGVLGVGALAISNMMKLRKEEQD